ncbi:MAG: lipoate--protein ligase [Prolixibacteraceae bacterium]|jgi:lipoate-protein ligase A|nr:lipoate--protein ligase [Prolixibacteraceae bacterium]
MLCILSTSNNPNYNLAAEEYLFKNKSEDVFFSYTNTPSVVVGKHQNALAEINPTYIRENNIKVIRRLSGGGAVYHDLGNLNFSFHQTVNDTAKISFKSFNEPIVEVLKSMGVPAQISPRNDIFVNDFKVSGHAEHVFRNRILSHGTLLFNSERENLSKALKNQSGTYSGKAIQSVRSKVANIIEFLQEEMSLEEFTLKIANHILQLSADNKFYSLTQKDNEAIHKLVQEKYSTWEWNFGYSPKYRFEKSIKIDSKDFAIRLLVEKGRISEVIISGNLLNQSQKKAVHQLILNSPHEFESIAKLLSEPHLQIPSRIIDCFF